MQTPIEYSRIADLYDTYVHTTLDVPFWIAEAGKTSGPVLELMAGTGRVSIPLAEAGADLTCVDLWPEMLDLLRAKLSAHGLRASVVAMDVRELALDRQFDLILIPFNSFMELPNRDDQRRTLAAVHAHLAEDGRFFCTLHNPAVRMQSVDGQLHIMPPISLGARQGTLVFSRVENYDQAAQLVTGLQFFEQYDANGLMQWKRVLEIRFSVVAQDEFRSMVESAGFQIAALYGSYDYAAFDPQTSPFMIWDLRKA
jgi:SAM-dependent methyltransferase